MTIEQQIRDFIVEHFLYGDSDNALKDKESFLESGIIDSTGVLELVSFLEENFEIEVEDEELVPENLDSIDSVKAYILRKQNNPAHN